MHHDHTHHTHEHHHAKKPLPNKIGGSYVYTLSSYGPVEAQVTIPYILDSDVEITANNFLADINPNNEEVNDKWISEHLDDINSLDELYVAVRHQLELLNDKFVEDQKKTQCTEQLSLRLNEMIPEMEIQKAQSLLIAQQEASLQSEGYTREDLAKANNTTIEDIDNALYNYAATTLEQTAALDAYAEHEKLICFDFEIAQQMQITEDQVKALLSNEITKSAAEQVKTDILRGKAANKVVRDAHIDLISETKEEALQHKEFLENNL